MDDDPYDTANDDRTHRAGVEWDDRFEMTVPDAGGIEIDVTVIAEFETSDIGLDPQHGPGVRVIKVLDSEKLDVTDSVDVDAIRDELYAKEFPDG